MTPVCEIDGLTRSFGGVKAVDGVSLAFTADRLHGLIGPNGAGKSTLVNLISGELRADAGRVVLEGRDISALAAHERALAGIARTFQTTRLPSTMTPAETVIAGRLTVERVSPLGYVLGRPGTRRSHRAARGRAAEILSLLELELFADVPIRELPFAEQRRTEIAHALALDPKLLLLDEPTAAMHVESLPAIGRVLRRLAADGRAVVIIEHNVPFIRDTVDVLYAMDAGALIAAGQPKSVLADPDVIESYLGASHEPAVG